MDDSDRSRDDSSAPTDDAVGDDGTADSGDTAADSDEGDEPTTDGVGSDGATSDESASPADDAAEDESESAELTPLDRHDGSARWQNTDPVDEGETSDDTAGNDGDSDAEDADNTEDAGGDTGGSPSDEEEIGGISAPESDQEMPLADHIEEMMRRLAVVFIFGGIATLVVVAQSTELINYFWSYHIPAPMENRPRLYGPLELPLTRLKVAGLAGVVVGLPAFVYQTYRFMKPGLYPNERRYYLAAVPTSLVLGGIGIAFAHFLVLPAIFSYFTTYTSDAATIAFGLAETFNLIVIMLAFMAIVFQIPLFIMLAIMMNIVTRQWLEAKRLIFWGSFLGIAFLFSPDPTGMAPIIVTLTMIVLFEGTLAVLRWTGN
ncbi:MFS transporter [Halorubrum sp. SD626R]|uniref:twin-arginine translocase subunit TatC n=1 Tax=Halorubrum TaxID=56688 RepID=UPI0010FA0B58|nr:MULTISPECIES: twin-arginine translocase subunit TatC [Halorubrum]TKX78702.1 MFS transporter [Halorubrum sp. SD626R]